MGYWKSCSYCGEKIYMAKVQPRNQYYARWLPFEDEDLMDCHKNYCWGQVDGSYRNGGK